MKLCNNNNNSNKSIFKAQNLDGYSKSKHIHTHTHTGKNLVIGQMLFCLISTQQNKQKNLTAFGMESHK